MLNHLSLGTNNFTQAKALFQAALAPLSYVLLEDFGDTVGYGPMGQLAALWISNEPTTPSAGFHLALSAPSPQAVAAFHKAALAHGATDNGAPGLRPNYSPTYYAAYIITQDGHHLEAVHGR